MAITATNVKARAPEFASLSDATVDIFIADAATRLSSVVWGVYYASAHLYLTAHLLSVSYPNMATASGPVQSETVGQVSRSYAVSARAVSGSYQTKWGRLYKELSKLVPTRFGVSS